MRESTEFNQDLWLVDEPKLQDYIISDVGMIYDKGIDYWFSVRDHLVRGKPVKAHTDYVMAHLPKKPTIEDDDSLNDILTLPDWEGIEHGVYVNIEKMSKGKKVTFTVLFNNNYPNGKVLKTALFVPPLTQPSKDFFRKQPMEIRQVFESLVTKYRRILFYDDPAMHEVLALAAMSTYFREAFRTYPYLDFQGAEVNSGKTTSMECLVYASFYGFTTMDPTGPVLFRAIDNCHAAIGIDEIDNCILDPDKNSAIQGILNSSYKRGTVAYRTNKETFQPEPYDAFGMKSFSRIKPIPDGLISRSITFLCVRAPIKMEQLAGPEVFQEERDAMYLARLKHDTLVAETEKEVWESLDMKNRDREKWISILTMAKLVGKETFEHIERYARANAKVMVEAQVDDVKKSLVEALLGKSGNVAVLDISESFFALLEKYDLIKKDYQGEPVKWQTRTVLRLLGELGVFKSPQQPREPGTGRTQVWVNKSRIDALARGTYGLLEPEYETMDEHGEVKIASQSSQSSQSSQEEKKE